MHTHFSLFKMVFLYIFYHSFVGGFDFSVKNIAIASVFMYSAS
jgi:hypothetical protein